MRYYALAIILASLITLVAYFMTTNNYDYLRLGSAKDVHISSIPSDRFTTIRNFTELPPRVSYHQGYRWYPTNANGGCCPEDKINYRVIGTPRKNGACAAVTKSQSECWKCCAERTHDFVDRKQCRIYCGGLPGGYRPSFDPQQFLYG